MAQVELSTKASFAHSSINLSHMVAELEQCRPGFDDSNNLTFPCSSASLSFDRFTDSSACEETDPLSAVGDLHVSSVTGEMFDLWKTGRSSVVPSPKDIQPESVPKLLITGNVVPYGGDKCASAFLQNVQISGSMVDGHEVLARTGHLDGATPFGASFDGGEFKPIDASSGSEIFTCPSFSVNARVQERTFDETINVPVPRVMEETVEAVKHVPDERVQNNTAEQIVAVPVPRIREETGQMTQAIPQDRISNRNGERVIDIPIPKIQENLVGMIQLVLQERISERIGATLALRIQETLFEVIQLIRKARIPERTVERSIDAPVSQIQKTVEVPQIQFINEAVGVPVIVQRQVPVVQKMQKAVEASQAQSTDRVANAPVIMQRQVPAVEVAQKTIGSLAENDHVTQEAEKYRDEDKVDKMKIKAKSGLENHCTAMRNTSIVKQMRSKFEVGHTNDVRARNRSDKDAQERVNPTNQRQVIAIRSAQKTVEVPRVQYIDKVASPWTCKDKCPPLRLHSTTRSISMKLYMSPRSLRVRFRTSRTMMKTGLSRRARRGNFPCQPKQSLKVVQTNGTVIDSTT